MKPNKQGITMTETDLSPPHAKDTFPMIARFLLTTIWSFGLGLSLQAQQTPFLDPVYTTSVTPDIQYATGSVGNPASGTIPLHLDLYKPVGASLPKTLPGLVIIHGGGFTSGTKSDPYVVLLCQAYAKRGYVTVSIQYRLAGDNPTYEAGPNPAEGATNRDRAINAAPQDAAKAIRWLRSNAVSLNMDPNRIAVGGGSAGAATSLFTGYQEAGTIGANAGVSVILDLWGAMSGGEFYIDADDPPVFIVHGDADQRVAYQESVNLVSRLTSIGVDYRFFTIQGADHGPWHQYFNNVVSGKTIDRHCADFFFKHLGLIELHPGAIASPSVLVNAPANTVKVSVATDPNFQYQLFSSINFTNWTPVHANKIAGTGNRLEVAAGPVGSRGFYRWNISPRF